MKRDCLGLVARRFSVRTRRADRCAAGYRPANFPNAAHTSARVAGSEDRADLGVLSDVDRALVLALGACAIEPGQPLREDEVNRRLGDWLADVGQMLRTDHVELRRWLVDAGFVARDGWGHAYVRAAAQLDLVRQALGTTDGGALATAVRSARVTAQTARLARRRVFDSRRLSVTG